MARAAESVLSVTISTEVMNLIEPGLRPYAAARRLTSSMLRLSTSGRGSLANTSSALRAANSRPAAEVPTGDPVLLFRFSALTFNGHRIHYDRKYCEEVEGYPGLIVHGPLMATLLMDLYLRNHPDARVTAFRFRARRPVFDVHPFTVCGAPTVGGADLWVRDHEGLVAMTATLEAE